MARGRRTKVNKYENFYLKRVKTDDRIQFVSEKETVNYSFKIKFLLTKEMQNDILNELRPKGPVPSARQRDEEKELESKAFFGRKDLFNRILTIE